MYRFCLVALLVAAPLAACAPPKQALVEDFSNLAELDQKSDAFSTHMRLLGSLDPGQSREVYYTSSPKFRGYVIEGSGPADLWVRSRSGKGDAVAWLLDSRFAILKVNDDADASTYDAHLTATLTAGKTYYLVVR